MQRHETMNLASLIAGNAVAGGSFIVVRSPYSGAEAGRVAAATRQDLEAAVAAALAFRDTPNRYERSKILDLTRAALESQREEFAGLITSESGLALRETRYEIGRAIEV